MNEASEGGGKTPGSERRGDYEIRFEPNPRRVRVEYNGTWIADSTRVVVVHETRCPPMYYFPKAMGWTPPHLIGI